MCGKIVRRKSPQLGLKCGKKELKKKIGTDEKISEKDTFECATKPCFGKKLSPNNFHHFYPPFPRGIQGDDKGIFVIIEAYVTTSISNIF